MKLALFGASGGVGSLILSQALHQGHQIRALYRSIPTHFKPNPHLEPIILENVADSKAIAETIRGTDGVISALGLRRRDPLNPFSKLVSPPDLTSTFAKALITACQLPESPKRVITVSAGGIGESWAQVSPVLRLLFSASTIGVAYQDLNQMEELFNKSSLDWTCVRPTTLNNRAKTEKVSETKTYGLTSQISRADVAWYILQCVTGTIRPSCSTPMISQSPRSR